MSILQKVAERAMLTASDPYLSAEQYRAALIEVCNMVLKAIPTSTEPDTDMREVRGSRSFRENLAREKGYDE
jgi:hypothetical protein